MRSGDEMKSTRCHFPFLREGPLENYHYNGLFILEMLLVPLDPKQRGLRVLQDQKPWGSPY